MLKFDHVRTMCAGCIQHKIAVPMCSLHRTAYKSSKPYIYVAHMQYVSARPSLHMCCICAVGKVQAHPAHVL